MTFTKALSFVLLSYSASKITACDPNDPQASLAGKVWKATSIRCYDDDENLCEVPAIAPVSAIFTAAGTVEGSSGCNGYYGTYDLEDSSLDFTEDFAATLLWCPDAMETEDAFKDAIDDAEEFIVTCDELKFVDDDGDVLATFEPVNSTLSTNSYEPHSSASPVGTLWSVTGIMINGTLTPPINNTEITANFTKGGALEGFGGCNNYKGDYTLGDNNSLALGPIAGTKRSCPVPAGLDRQEFDYLTLLSEVAMYKVDGPVLQLLDSSENLLVEYSSPTEESSTCALTDKVWMATTIVNGTDEMDVINGTQVTALFTVKSGFSGSAGCNNYQGSYNATSDEITVDENMIVTLKYCGEDGVNDQETLYLQNLRSAAFYSIVGCEELELRASDDSLLVRYTAGADAPDVTVAVKASPGYRLRGRQF